MGNKRRLMIRRAKGYDRWSFSFEAIREQFDLGPVLGCGDHGCVFADRDKVVKVTIDEYEFKACHKLAAAIHKHPMTAKFYDFAIHERPTSDGDIQQTYLIWREPLDDYIPAKPEVLEPVWEEFFAACNIYPPPAAMEHAIATSLWKAKHPDEYKLVIQIRDFLEHCYDLGILMGDIKTDNLGGRADGSLAIRDYSGVFVEEPQEDNELI